MEFVQGRSVMACDADGGEGAGDIERPERCRNLFRFLVPRERPDGDVGKIGGRRMSFLLEHALIEPGVQKTHGLLAFGGKQEDVAARAEQVADRGRPRQPKPDGRDLLRHLADMGEKDVRRNAAEGENEGDMGFDQPILRVVRAPDGLDPLPVASLDGELGEDDYGVNS